MTRVLRARSPCGLIAHRTLIVRHRRTSSWRIRPLGLRAALPALPLSRALLRADRRRRPGRGLPAPRTPSSCEQTLRTPCVCRAPPPALRWRAKLRVLVYKPLPPAARPNGPTRRNSTVTHGVPRPCTLAPRMRFEPRRRLCRHWSCNVHVPLTAAHAYMRAHAMCNARTLHLSNLVGCGEPPAGPPTTSLRRGGIGRAPRAHPRRRALIALSEICNVRTLHFRTRGSKV